MFKNYLKIAFRNIVRHKGYSFINIAGLAIGMAAFLLLLMYTHYERSYDSFHQNADRIYRVRNDRIYSEIHDKSAGCPPVVGPTLKKEFPEILEFARIWNPGSSRVTKSTDTKSETKTAAVEGGIQQDDSVTLFREDRLYFADASFLRMFSFPLLQGTPGTALEEPDTAVLSESTAVKYFGDSNPIGKTITVMNGIGTLVCKITGIVKDIPENSHLKFDFLLSFKTLAREDPRVEITWGWNAFNTYILLSPSANPNTLQAKFPQLAGKYDFQWADFKRELLLQPLRDIHLHSHLRHEPDVNGDNKTIVLLETIGIFILIVAWMNYINLSTARSMTRAMEVGVRKTLGAQRSHLVRQFLFESTFLNILAVLLAISFFEISLPYFHRLLGIPLSLSIAGSGWIRVMLFIFAGAILSGFYPAFILSSFKPEKYLKGRFSRSAKGTVLRRFLIVMQFTISILLIASTFIVGHQISFMRSRDLGMNKEQVLSLRIPYVRGEMRNNVGKLRNEFSKPSSVKGLTISSTVPGRGYTLAASGFRKLAAKPEEGQRVFFIDADFNFFSFFDIPLLCGRSFSGDFDKDRKTVILNEDAVKLLGFDKPEKVLHQTVVLGGLGGLKREVIGVARNYHHKSPKDRIESIVFSPAGASNFLSLRIDIKNIDQVLSFSRAKWKEIFPGYPLEYFFLDEAYNKQYQSDQRFGRVFGGFAFFSILISCLGLFGLASYATQQRMKEIGIRKVLGATIPGILFLLNREFGKWVLLANIIAWPAAYILMNKWLQNFAYRTTIGIGTFIVSGLLALIIAFLTVSHQSIRAATANPVEALRYE